MNGENISPWIPTDGRRAFPSGKDGEKDTLCEAAQALRSMFSNRADLGRRLIDQVQNDIVATLQGMLQQHSVVYKKIVQDAHRIAEWKRSREHNYEVYSRS